MEDITLLSASALTTAMGFAVVAYIKHMKKRARRFILRHEVLQSYFSKP